MMNTPSHIPHNAVLTSTVPNLKKKPSRNTP